MIIRSLQLKTASRRWWPTPSRLVAPDVATARPPFRMPARAWLFLLLCAGQPAQAQTNVTDADPARSSLMEALSMITLGVVSPQDQTVTVTRRGSDYQVRLPLKGFSAPADAAIDATARPADGGMWDFESMTFPPAGTINATMRSGETAQVEYAIGEQRTRVEIDPRLDRPSSFDTNLGAITMNVLQAHHRSEQACDRFVLEGAITPDRAGTLDLASHSVATNWRLITHEPDTAAVSTEVRTLTSRLVIEGIDRREGARVLAEARTLLPAAAPSPPHEPSGAASMQAPNLPALIDAFAGLLNRFEADETLDGVSFSVGPATHGTIHRVDIKTTGSARAQRVDGRIDMVIDGISLDHLPDADEAYLPHHVVMRSALSGVQSSAFADLLRSATEPTPDPTRLWTRFTALVADPRARIGVESLAFDTGPMQVTGAMRIVPRANGLPGADIHIVASGMDALIAELQGKPGLQQILPLIFMAKGMGRQESGGMVWDIAVGNGPITVNGVPFGQPVPQSR